MNALTAAKVGVTEQVPAGLEERLEWLRKFGKPRLSMSSGGWYSCIDMNTNSTGSEFKVASEFDHRLPSEAVAVLIERMLTALTALGVSQ